MADLDAIRDGLEKDRMTAVVPPRPKDVRIINDLLAEVERLRAIEDAARDFVHHSSEVWQHGVDKPEGVEWWDAWEERRAYLLDKLESALDDREETT